MTGEPGESPLFAVVSGHPDAEDLAALTAVLAARLAARQRAAAAQAADPPGPVSLARPRGADPGPAAPRSRRLAPLSPPSLRPPPTTIRNVCLLPRRRGKRHHVKAGGGRLGLAPSGAQPGRQDRRRAGR